MKHWEKAIDYKWRSKSSHAFFLYLNVADSVVNEKEKRFETLREYLVSSSPVGRAEFVASYNRGEGIRFLNNNEEERFLKLLARLHPAKDQSNKNAAVRQFELHRRELPYALALFGEMLEISRKDECAQLEGKNGGAPFFAAILEYVETIVPPEAATSSCQGDRDALVTLRTWATNQKLKEANNLVIFVGESLELVAPQLRSETSGIIPLKIEFPDLEDREIAIETERAEKEHRGLTAIEFARLSAGMSRNVICNMIREATLKKLPVSTDTIFAKKKKFIEEQSGGLLEIRRQLWGPEVLGGLETLTDYMCKVVDAMKRGDLLAVPMGILGMGAPGTAKTAFFQAFAYIAGIPFVIMKNTRNPYVGVSERNQEFSFELIQALAPVVVLVDEIDQQTQSRSRMDDNTGVSNRLMARQLDFMGDDMLRGKVVWAGISNMPFPGTSIRLKTAMR